MCKSKQAGGMGFRDFEAFNKSLLAKQAWRLLTCPNFIVCSCFKSKILSHVWFMESPVPRSASTTWKSIIHGRLLLREGLVWRVGNGSKINIWMDNWIPRDGLIRPIGAKDMQNINYVDDLLDYSWKNWDLPTLQWVFSDYDVVDISQIVVGGLGRDDMLAWNYTKNGQFTVWSTYHLEMKMKELSSGSPECSSSAAMHARRNELWCTDVPGKAKVHSWRLLKNGLAVGA